MNVLRSWCPRCTLGSDCPTLAGRSLFYNFQRRPSSTPAFPIANERVLAETRESFGVSRGRPRLCSQRTPRFERNPTFSSKFRSNSRTVPVHQSSTLFYRYLNRCIEHAILRVHNDPQSYILSGSGVRTPIIFSPTKPSTSGSTGWSKVNLMQKASCALQILLALIMITACFCISRSNKIFGILMRHNNVPP